MWDIYPKDMQFRWQSQNVGLRTVKRLHSRVGGTDEKTNEGAEDKPFPPFLLVLVMRISVEYKDY